MNPQVVYTVTGIISSVTAFLAMIGGFYIWRSSVGRAANEIQQSAISALRAELATIRNKCEDQAKEIVRLNHIISTICTALKNKGIAITIDGEIINIRDNGNTLVARIQEGQEAS